MIVINRNPEHRRALHGDDAAALGGPASADAARQMAHLPDFAPTPLHSLAALAERLGVGAIQIKDEGQRLGLGSFKALGGMFALHRLVQREAGRRLGRTVGSNELAEPEVREAARSLTFGCATDGNHGRSVAAGAQLAGARAVIFVHSGVSEGRVDAIRRFGAEIVVVPGSYDDAVAEAAHRCAREGWTVLSDTSWAGYEEIPLLVMQGYTVLVREALRSLAEPPTHLFVQAGVGGLAAAVAGHLHQTLGEGRPHVVVVEPARAACVLETARVGAPVSIAHGRPTVMAMLECYAPSPVAWRVLCRAADAFMTVDEDDAVAVMRQLANPLGADPQLVAGESGGVGLAGLIRAATDASMRESLGIDATSRVLTILTEGATDAGLYRKLVGGRQD